MQVFVQDICLRLPCPSVATCSDFLGCKRPRLCNAHAQSCLFMCSLLQLPKWPWPQMTSDLSLRCSVNTTLSGAQTRTRMLGQCKCKCTLSRRQKSKAHCTYLNAYEITYFFICCFCAKSVPVVGSNGASSAWDIAVVGTSSRVRISTCRMKEVWLNTSPPGKNGSHFTDDLFRCIFVKEKFWILIKIPLKFVPKGLLNNNPAMV